MFPNVIWGTCQDLFQQLIGRIWARRKKLMENEDGEVFIQACKDLAESEEDGYWL